MSRRASWGILIFAVVPALANAQQGDSLVLFVGGTVAGGRTPMLLAAGTRTGTHAAIRLDAGFQRGAFSFGLGGRYWHLPRTSEFGGSGFDLFALGEMRLVSRTSIRLAAGTSNENIDVYYGPTGNPASAAVGQIHNYIHRNGFVASAGLLHLIPISSLNFVISADAFAPIMGDEENGRRRPVLELGIGLRRHSIPPALSGPRQPARISHL